MMNPRLNVPLRDDDGNPLAVTPSLLSGRDQSIVMFRLSLINGFSVGINDGNQSFGGGRPAPQGFHFDRVLLQDPLRGSAFSAGAILNFNVAPVKPLCNQIPIDETTLLKVFTSHDDLDAISKHGANPLKPVPQCSTRCYPRKYFARGFPRLHRDQSNGRSRPRVH